MGVHLRRVEVRRRGRRRTNETLRVSELETRLRVCFEVEEEEEVILDNKGRIRATLFTYIVALRSREEEGSG